MLVPFQRRVSERALHAGGGTSRGAASVTLSAASRPETAALMFSRLAVSTHTHPVTALSLYAKADIQHYVTVVIGVLLQSTASYNQFKQ